MASITSQYRSFIFYALLSLRLLTCRASALTNDVEPLSKIVKQLADSGGFYVKVAPQLAGQPVWVEGHGQTPLNLLKDLAVACHARLTRTTSGYELTRTREDVTVCKVSHVNVAKGWLIERLKTWDRETEQERRLGNNIRQLEDVVHQNALDEHRRAISPRDSVFHSEAVWLTVVTPAGRLLRRLVDRIGIERLSEIDSNDRRFFSNSPTPEEARVRGCQTDLRQFVADEQELSRAKISTRFKADLQAIGKKKIGYEGLFPDSRNLKVLLTETRTEEQINLLLEVFGPQGQKVDKAFMTTGSSDSGPLPMFFNSNGNRNIKAHWIPLDSTSQAAVNIFFLHWQAYKVRAQDAQREPWLDSIHHSLKLNKLPVVFLRPEDYEPCDFVIPVGLEAISHDNTLGAVVARIPDTVLSYAMNCTRDGMLDETAFRQYLFGEAGSESVSNGTDTVIRPKDPLLADSMFANRRTVGRAIRNFLDEGSISIKDRSKLLYRLGSAATSPVAAFYVDQVVGGLPQFGNSVRSTDPLIFRLLGSLTDEDWGEMERKGKVQLSESSADKRILEKIVRCDVLAVQGSRSLPDLYRHSVELFPEGLISNLDGLIKASPEVAVAFETGGSLFPINVATMGGEYYAFSRFSREMALRRGTSVSLEKLFQGVVQGDRRVWHTARGHSYSLVIELPEGQYMKSHLADITNIDPEAHKAEDLPDAYLNKLYEDFKRIATQSPSPSVSIPSIGERRPRP